MAQGAHADRRSGSSQTDRPHGELRQRPTHSRQRMTSEILYVTGAGGHGREVHTYLRDLQDSGWAGELKGYLDDGLAPGVYGRLNVLGPLACLKHSQENGPRV